MLIDSLLLPSDITWEVLDKIAIPVLVLYPVGSLLVCILFHDHESRIWVEEDLISMKRHFELALKTTISSTFDINLISGKTVTSPALYLDLGYDLLEIPDSTVGLVKIIHPDDLLKLMRMLYSYSSEEDAMVYCEFRVLSKEGSWKWCSLSGQIIERRKDGKPLRLIGISTQITARKREEDEKLRLQNLESLGSLAGGIAHDFNNILSVIIGQAGLILSRI
jgi:PAS domain S-box-containing protein